MNNLHAGKKIYWRRVPSRPTISNSFFIFDTEPRLYELLDKMGIISGGQIQAHRILDRNIRRTRQILARLTKSHKIVEHILKMGNKDYKLYTLGPAGAELIGADYQPDYWFAYTDSEVIERVLTLEFYLKLSDYLSAEVIVKPADPPYIYTFSHSNKVYNIGIVWDNATRFIEAYRWSPPEERTILICQEIAQLNCLLEYFAEYTPIRAITREKIKGELVFYRPEMGQWVLDVPNRQIKQKVEKKIIRRKQVLL